MGGYTLGSMAPKVYVVSLCVCLLFISPFQCFSFAAGVTWPLYSSPVSCPCPPMTISLRYICWGQSPLSRKLDPPPPQKGPLAHFYGVGGGVTHQPEGSPPGDHDTLFRDGVFPLPVYISFSATFTDTPASTSASTVLQSGMWTTIARQPGCFF